MFARKTGSRLERVKKKKCENVAKRAVADELKRAKIRDKIKLDN